MQIVSQTVFRQCICPAQNCGLLFFICPSCDKQRVYCSKTCSAAAAKINHRAANRRYQQSLKGRRRHANRQRVYRRRLAERLSQQSIPAEPAVPVATAPAELAPADHAQQYPLEKKVTDCTYPSQAKGATMRSTSFLALGPERRSGFTPRPELICRFCGRRGSFINPFPISYRRRH